VKGNVLTHVCLFLDETPGYGKIFFRKICGLSVCVAVHVPGVPQPVLPALTGVCVWSVCVAVYVPGVPQPVLPALTGVCVCVCGLCV